MCLIVDMYRHFERKPIILKEDLECFKVLKYFIGIANYYTPYQEYPIELNTLYITKMSSRGCGREIHKGFHSFVNVENISSTMILFSNKKVFKAIYPKGTRIYYGIDGDIVGNKIIITDEEIIV